MSPEEFVKFSMKAFMIGRQLADYMDDYEEDEMADALKTWETFMSREATDPELVLCANTNFVEGFKEMVQELWYDGKPDYDKEDIARLLGKFIK